MAVSMSADQQAPTGFYDKRYSKEWQALQDKVFAEAQDGYFGQSSLTSTADYDRIARWLDAGHGGHVLDMACGSGAPSLRLAKATGCMVTGADISAQAIAKATAAATQAQLAQRVRFIQHDASQPLPFAPGSFDAIMCVDALVHLVDRHRIFAGWHAALKPGGRLVITDSILTGPVSNAEIAERTVSGFYLFVPDGYNQRLLREAGFELRHFEDITATLAESARRHCAARERHAAELRAMEGEAMFATLTRYRAMVERLARERRLSHHLVVAAKPADA
mgnify:CR=1 FL=1